MDTSKELIPVSSLIRESWQKYIKQFDSLIWIPIIPTLIVAFGDYLNISSDPFLQGIGNIMVLVGFVFSIISGVALIYAAQNGKQFNESYKYAQDNFFKYIWIAILEMVIAIGGLFLLIIPALLFTVWFSFAGYVFVLEGDHGIEALLKSKEYFRGRFWPIVWRLFALLLIAFFSAVIAGILGSVAGQPGIIALTFIFQIILAPFLVVYELGIYNNLRQLRPEIVNTKVQNDRTGFTIAALWGVVAPILLGTVMILVYGLSAAISYVMK